MEARPSWLDCERSPRGYFRQRERRAGEARECVLTFVPQIVLRGSDARHFSTRRLDRRSLNLERYEVSRACGCGFVVGGNLAIPPIAGEIIGANQENRLVVWRAEFESAV